MSRTGSDTWRDLLHRALLCLDSLPASGTAAPRWTLGGGTVLTLRYRHRLSKDIDIFLSDPQYLTLLSPRLNDIASGLTDDYLEASNHLKLSFADGEIDFIVAPDLTGAEPAAISFEGREILTDHSAEIIAKKLFYRAASLKVRDIFDMATVLLNDPSVAATVRPLLAPKAGQLRRRLAVLKPSFDARLRTEVDLLPTGETIAPRAFETAWRLVDAL